MIQCTLNAGTYVLKDFHQSIFFVSKGLNISSVLIHQSNHVENQSLNLYTSIQSVGKLDYF